MILSSGSRGSRPPPPVPPRPSKEIVAEALAKSRQTPVLQHKTFRKASDDENKVSKIISRNESNITKYVNNFTNRNLVQSDTAVHKEFPKPNPRSLKSNSSYVNNFQFKNNSNVTRGELKINSGLQQSTSKTDISKEISGSDEDSSKKSMDFKNTLTKFSWGGTVVYRSPSFIKDEERKQMERNCINETGDLELRNVEKFTENNTKANGVTPKQLSDNNNTVTVTTHAVADKKATSENIVVISNNKQDVGTKVVSVNAEQTQHAASHKSADNAVDYKDHQHIIREDQKDVDTLTSNKETRMYENVTFGTELKIQRFSEDDDDKPKIDNNCDKEMKAESPLVETLNNSVINNVENLIQITVLTNRNESPKEKEKSEDVETDSLYDRSTTSEFFTDSSVSSINFDRLTPDSPLDLNFRPEPEGGESEKSLEYISSPKTSPTSVKTSSLKKKPLEKTNSQNTDSSKSSSKSQSVSFSDMANHELLISELQNMRIEHKIRKRQRMPSETLSVSFKEDYDTRVGSNQEKRIQTSDWVEIGANGTEVVYSSCQIIIDDKKTNDRFLDDDDGYEYINLSDKEIDSKDDDTSVSSSSLTKDDRRSSIDSFNSDQHYSRMSLPGLPPLPKSLSGFELKGGAGGTRPPPPDPPRASRAPATLDSQLAVLRREMFSLRQLDLSLLSQLWALNESIQEFRQLMQEQEALSPPSPSPTPSASSGDEGDDPSPPSPMRRPAPPPPPARKAPTRNSSAV